MNETKRKNVIIMIIINDHSPANCIEFIFEIFEFFLKGIF